MKKLVAGFLKALSFFLGTFFAENPAFAGRANYDIAVVSAQSSDKYSLPKASNIKAFRFGKASIGSFQVSGDVNEKTSYNGFDAFGLGKGNLVFTYNYNGS